MNRELTVSEYAERAGVTAEFVRMLIRSGQLRARQINPSAARPTYRISEGAISNYEARCQR